MSRPRLHSFSPYLDQLSPPKVPTKIAQIMPLRRYNPRLKPCSQSNLPPRSEAKTLVAKRRSPSDAILAKNRGPNIWDPEYLAPASGRRHCYFLKSASATISPLSFLYFQKYQPLTAPLSIIAFPAADGESYHFLPYLIRPRESTHPL